MIRSADDSGTEYMFPFHLDDYGLDFYEQTYEESMKYLSILDQKENRCLISQSPYCSFMPSKFKEKMGNKEKLYDVPKDLEEIFKKFIIKNDLYQKESVLYKVGVYQFLDIFSKHDNLIIIIDFDEGLKDMNIFKADKNNTELDRIL